MTTVPKPATPSPWKKYPDGDGLWIFQPKDSSEFYQVQIVEIPPLPGRVRSFHYQLSGKKSIEHISMEGGKWQRPLSDAELSQIIAEQEVPKDG